MRVSDDLLKCVGFVSRQVDPLQYRGTAFIVTVAAGGSYSVAHLVTAKHVAIELRAGESVIAFNGKDGAPRFAQIADAPWFFHPTEPDSVDVAIMPFAIPNTDDYDISPVPERLFTTDSRISEFRIGLGDEVVSVGLFTPFFGTTRLTPIVRTGNIAMMPRDRQLISNFGHVEAYLIDGQSIGGLSGSPVFCRNTLAMPTMDQEKRVGRISGYGALHLLGLVHGHYDLPTSFADGERSAPANTGISIVVPAKKILEVLHHPDLCKLRDERTKT